ncbi:hypothetical protein ACIPYQ_10860 [Streptomyces sp. NPDC090045]|uniref:hypothetical protein n=1 Tax=Streptomyces sp. NPDC090045 TaxID=3365927 RepID=UPI0038165CE4
MQRIRTTALVVAAALAAGAGIAYAQQGASHSAASRQITTHVVWGHSDLNPGQVGTARTDDCPPGQLVTGGGGFLSSSDLGAFTMSASSIAWNSGPKGWFVTGRNNGTVRATLFTYGLCTAAVTDLPAAADVEGRMPAMPPNLTPGKPDAPAAG